MTTQANLWSRAEALCRAVAPHELTPDVPLYLVRQSELDDAPSRCHGYTSPALDLTFRHVIGGRWRGRGPCMVIDDLGLVLPRWPEEYETDVFATVLHELAHVLQAPRLVLPEPADTPQERQHNRRMASLVQAWSTESRGDGSEALAKQFYDHEAPGFLRVLFHLAHRAEQQLGQRFAPGRVHYRIYGQTPPGYYREALGDEPARLAGWPIRSILNHPLPPAFAALWRDDVAALDSILSNYRKDVATMTLSNLLEKITDQQKQRQQSRQQEYRKLVNDVADGKDQNPAKVEQLLDICGRTVQDLAGAVERLLTRRQLGETIQRAKAASGELEQVEKKLTAAEAKLTKAREEYASLVNPLVEHRRLLEEMQRQAETARDRLIATCTDEGLQAELDAVRGRLKGLVHEQNDLASREHRLKELLGGQEAIAQQSSFESQIKDAKDEAKRLRGKLDECQAKQKETRSAIETALGVENLILDRQAQP